MSEPKPKLEPWQVIANQLQVSRRFGTEDYPFVDCQDLAGWSQGCVKMLKAYGYEIKFNPGIAPR